jgi:phenylacetate-CoA ligase
MFIFGQFKKTHPTNSELEKIFLTAQEKKEKLRTIPIENIIKTLAQVGKLWAKNSQYYKKAQKQLHTELNFSPEMITYSLDMVSTILQEDIIRKRLLAEFESLESLDHFTQTSRFSGKIFYQSHGVLTHITAGNIFLGFLDSLLMGIITKNVNVIKLSHKNNIFPELFLQSMLEADTSQNIVPFIALLYWKGGDESKDLVAKNYSDVIMCWGGEEMVKSYKKNLPLKVKILDYGPKVSFQVLSKKYYNQIPIEKLAKEIAADICLWDQSACSSPQNLFVENGCDISKLIKFIKKEIDQFPLKRGILDHDSSVELLKDFFRGKTNEFFTQHPVLSSKEGQISYDRKRGLTNSALNRSLILKSYSTIKDLKEQIEPYSFYLQSCSYGLASDEKNKYLRELSGIGVKRFSVIGSIMFGTIGAPHDGHLSLLELTTPIPLERYEGLLELSQEAYQHPFYKNYYKTIPKKENEIPLLSSKDLHAFKPGKNFNSGHIFSSGGTTGKPKYSFYSTQEFNWVTKRLAESYRNLGIEKGDKVINLFAAGNLWSSFLAVEKMLESIQAVQLSLGNQSSNENLLEIILKFSPQTLMGIPTTLIDFAHFVIDKKIQIRLKNIFYAGEHLSESGEKLLRKAFHTNEIHSAGYASVDAGPIGYQCKHCKPGEHHVFDDLIYLERIKDEAVVTTKYREVMPIIRLRTGDEISELIQGNCPCGHTSIRFKLLGRLDHQMNILGCRVGIVEFERALEKFKITNFQIIIENKKGKDQLTIQYETDKMIDPNQILKVCYQEIKDIRESHSFDYIKKHILLKKVEKTTRIQKTGKLKRIIDRR